VKNRILILAFCVHLTSSIGIADDRIIGGDEVLADDPIAATTAALIFKSNDQYYPGCTLSLLAADIAVTAAHCLGKAEMYVAFNRKIVTDDGHVDVPALRLGRVVAAQMHEGYRGPDTSLKDRNDIALLRFEGGLPAGYAPAQLLSQRDRLQDGMPVVLAGYGVSDDWTGDGPGILRRADVILLDAEYSATEVQTDQHLGKGACRGDSGGPAFVKRGASYYLFGVTNWGPGHCDQFGVYANINAYRDWLAQTVSQLRAAPQASSN
jgi:secreted trypsin-like serine protease